MAPKKFCKLFIHCVWLSAIVSFSTALFAEQDAAQTRTVEIQSSQEFSFIEQSSSTFKIRPLKDELRSIENLKDAEAVGVVYLGNIELGNNATPLSALRDISVQISKGLDLDLALITDSTTSKSLAPHELLLLYHPQMVITLALTKVVQDSGVDQENNDNDGENENAEEEAISNEQYALIGTYAIPVKPQIIPIVPPVEETVE